MEHIFEDYVSSATVQPTSHDIQKLENSTKSPTLEFSLRIRIRND